jgi:hypothetical protein
MWAFLMQVPNYFSVLESVAKEAPQLKQDVEDTAAALKPVYDDLVAVEQELQAVLAKKAAIQAKVAPLQAAHDQALSAMHDKVVATATAAATAAAPAAPAAAK